MQRLVECLSCVDECPLPNDATMRLDIVDHPLIDEIVFLATRLFIDDTGAPLFDMMDKLQKDHDYMIFPGERNRFGWVTACLQTKKGFIVFG